MLNSFFEVYVFSCTFFSATQVSYQYYLCLSPTDGNLYVSDPEKHQILRVLNLNVVNDPLANSEVVAGSGERCVPGDMSNCGDNGLAVEAKLSHPKGTYLTRMYAHFVDSDMYQVSSIIFRYRRRS